MLLRGKVQGMMLGTMNARTFTIGLALTWLVATCSWTGSTADDGKLAAVRFVITKLPEATRSAPLYVVIDDGPPSEEFVQRLTGADRLIHAATVTTHDFPRKTPRPGVSDDSITVWAADFDQWAEHGAKVHAGYYRNDGIGEELVLDLRREAGRWRVAE